MANSNAARLRKVATELLALVTDREQAIQDIGKLIAMMGAKEEVHVPGYGTVRKAHLQQQKENIVKDIAPMKRIAREIQDISFVVDKGQGWIP